MYSDTLDRSVLSNRENQIVDHAIEGMTDIQIALKMDISPSTVNSYWVRIRGKLGAQTRTELVSRALRQEADKLRERITELEREALLRHHVITERGAVEVFQAAFDALPECAGILNDKGLIVYCNQRLIRLLNRNIDRVVGQPLASLLTVAGRGTGTPDGLPASGFEQLGIREVLYLARGDATPLRVILTVDWQERGSGNVGSFVIRPFLSVVDQLRQQAREASNSRLSYPLDAGGGKPLGRHGTLRDQDKPPQL